MSCPKILNYYSKKQESDLFYKYLTSKFLINFAVTLTHSK